MREIPGLNGSNAKRFPVTQSLRPLLCNCEDCEPDAAHRLVQIQRRLGTERWRICDNKFNIVINVTLFRGIFAKNNVNSFESLI